MPAAGGGCACVHRLEGDWGGLDVPYSLMLFLASFGRKGGRQQAPRLLRGIRLVWEQCYTWYRGWFCRAAAFPLR